MDEFSSESSLDLPNLNQSLIDIATLDRLQCNEQPTHKPRILALMGAETAIFDPSGLPLPDDAPQDHPKVKELRDLVLWSEGQVWCSPTSCGSSGAGCG